MTELIKELKRDIINDYTYDELEKETHDLEGITCRNETLKLESGKILYACYENHEDGKTFSGAGIISSDIKDFLKTPVVEIVNQINACYFYNVMEEEE